MGSTACTEPQCLYKDALYLIFQVFEKELLYTELPFSRTFFNVSVKFLINVLLMKEILPFVTGFWGKYYVSRGLCVRKSIWDNVNAQICKSVSLLVLAISNA